MDDSLCLCFPCILSYLDGYIHARSEDQFYPSLHKKGFSATDQQAIAEEWYWVSFERETAVKDYMAGYVTFRDGCWWRPPPQLPRRAAPPAPLPRRPPGDASRRTATSRTRRAPSLASTEASSSSSSSSEPSV